MFGSLCIFRSSYMCRGLYILSYWLGVFGDFADCVGAVFEFYAAGILYRYVERAEDQFGAFEVDGVAHQGVDDFHQAGLDALFVLEDRDRVETTLGWFADAAMGVLVEVAETLSVESRGAAADSGDLDMSASFCGCHSVDKCVDLLENFLVLGP